MKKENTITEAWKLYERGKSWNMNLTPSQYNTVKTNCEFFTGNQWLHLPNTPAMRSLPKPVFNILKRVASLFIASLTSSGVTLHFEPLAYYDGGAVVDPDHSLSQFANAEVANLLEKFKFEYRIRDALFDGAQTGDYCAHFYFDPDSKPYGGMLGPNSGEIQMELVDGINVIFGNPNDRRVDHQPYIIIVGRDTCEHLQWEAERYRKNKAAYGDGGIAGNKDDIFQPDMENNEFLGVGAQNELFTDEGDGKCIYLYMYTMCQKEVDKLDPRTGEPVLEDEVDKDGLPVFLEGKDGQPRMDAFGHPIPKRKNVKKLVNTIHVTKATRSAIIYEDVDTGLSRYPIAWGNWEKQKNQYHGRALITGLLPNQIFINTMFATAMRHMQLLAFPKTVYNADLISSWSNEVGQAIGVHGLQPGMSIQQVAENLQPANLSAQIFQLIDMALAYTKECLGATDAQMGQTKIDNTSALMVLQTNAEVPLENIRSGEYEWVEDIAAILLDMMGTYYGNRPVVLEETFEEPVMGPTGAPMIDPMTGMMKTQTTVHKVVREFDFNKFKDMYLNVRVDVGATTYFSEIAMTQTLDNLRKDGTLDVIQYLERIPDKLIPKKRELLDELRGRIAKGTQANAAAGAAIPEPGAPISNSGMGTPQPSSGSSPITMGAPLTADNAMAALPTGAQTKLDAMPNITKKTSAKLGQIMAG